MRREVCNQALLRGFGSEDDSKLDLGGVRMEIAVKKIKEKKRRGKDLKLA